MIRLRNVDQYEAQQKVKDLLDRYIVTVNFVSQFT